MGTNKSAKWFRSSVEDSANVKSGVSISQISGIVLKNSFSVSREQDCIKGSFSYVSPPDFFGIKQLADGSRELDEQCTKSLETKLMENGVVLREDVKISARGFKLVSASGIFCTPFSRHFVSLTVFVILLAEHVRSPEKPVALHSFLEQRFGMVLGRLKTLQVLYHVLS